MQKKLSIERQNLGRRSIFKFVRFQYVNYFQPFLCHFDISLYRYKSIDNLIFFNIVWIHKDWITSWIGCKLMKERRWRKQLMTTIKSCLLFNDVEVTIKTFRNAWINYFKMNLWLNHKQITIIFFNFPQLVTSAYLLGKFIIFHHT